MRSNLHRMQEMLHSNKALTIKAQWCPTLQRHCDVDMKPVTYYKSGFIPDRSQACQKLAHPAGNPRPMARKYCSELPTRDKL